MSDATLKQDNDPKSPQPKLSSSRCPVCSRPTVPEYEPFCSPRCTDVDLNRWFTGAYAIPGGQVQDEEQD